MDRSLSLAALAADAGCPHGSGDVRICGLTSDSREVQPGYLFAALAGSRADGASYIGDAVAAGAVAVLGDSKLPAGAAGSVPVIRDRNPRRRLALMAARFHVGQPHTIAAVTETNGKTSVASFTRQIWQALGFRAASMGTIGIEVSGKSEPLKHTTPDPVYMHRKLRKLKEDGIDYLAIEASSHGLAQHRMDGVRLAAGAFTNITRDHLDYHPTFESYFEAKLRLFGELLGSGCTAVIDADCPDSVTVVKRATERGLQIYTVGRKGRALQLLRRRFDGFRQHLVVRGMEAEHELTLPLVGEFQITNALVAAGLAISSGNGEEIVLDAVQRLKGAKGRLELVAKTSNGAPVFVDYAHTPDALSNALKALRPYVKGQLVVLFGAGGDRDPGKRPLMGEAAARHADVVIVTDDNPRSEDPAEIRGAVMEGCPDAIEVANRADAITRAVKALDAGDILLVAGKGHESGQIIGEEVLPFSDHEVVQEAAGKGGK